MTRYLAGKVFSEDKRDNLLEKISTLWKKIRNTGMPKSVKQSYKELLQRFSVIRRVVAADRCIRVVEFHCFCLDTYLFLLLISDGLHLLLAHTWEHTVLNQNMGLASESEQPVECSHRERREERLQLSRKTDLKSTLVDTSLM